LEGSVAGKLDFGETTGTAVYPGRAALRLALSSSVLRGRDKYKVLEHRRRQAQIRARHLLDLMEGE
jgi:hypothetical protein